MSEQVRLTSECLKTDPAKLAVEIEDFIRSTFLEYRRDGIVVTISGGLDSSVAAALCVRAIGKDKVVGLMLPEIMGNPEALVYGKLLAGHLGIRTKKINISPILIGLGTFDLFMSAISGRKNWEKPVDRYLHKRGRTTKTDYLDSLRGTSSKEARKLIAIVSSKQRARLLAATRFAEENNYILAGATHRTE